MKVQNIKTIVAELERNKTVFQALLENESDEIYRWRSHDNHWCLLEIVCHLYDIEVEDFRIRTKHTLETPHEPLLPIEPTQWIIDRKYIDQDYKNKLALFLKERHYSIQWLGTLNNPQWQNICEHPDLGPITAKKFLANWLAHDYLHIRQINRIRYAYLQQLSQEDLSYSGNW